MLPMALYRGYIHPLAALLPSRIPLVAALVVAESGRLYIMAAIARAGQSAGASPR